jgi:hypothetical protein
MFNRMHPAKTPCLYPRTARIICVHPLSEQADAAARQNVYLAPEVQDASDGNTDDSPLPQIQREFRVCEIDVLIDNPLP